MPPRSFFTGTTMGTFVVALVLCVACSVLVSASAVSLKAWQDSNKALDKKKNVLLAAGYGGEISSSADVDRIFDERIERQLIDLETGAPATEDRLAELGVEIETYDAKKASKDPSLQQPIADAALPGIANREPLAEVYKIVEGGTVQGYIFPIYGKGLWSTLYGFVALEGDGETVRGITYYEHKETPGLGGEVDNKKWQASWQEKKVYGEGGEVELDVLKGKASPDDAYAIDGLSGATITTKGVDQMIKYWLGPDAFGKYLEQQKG